MRTILAAFLILSMGAAGAAAGEAPPAFTKKPKAMKAGGRVRIEFAVSRRTDVEVAVLNARGDVVRHLAAGVLGGKNPPPAPLKPGLSQSIEWDGRDDYGEQARGGPFKVRVRAGMGVELDKIVGGDPYAFYSRQMGQGDHAAWRITGLEAKSDGTVYVLGNANNYGPPALRRYDAEGNYLRTVFPPPAGKTVDQVKGWGIVVKEDGTYSFRYNDLSSPALSKTIISGTRGQIADLFPCAEKGKLLLGRGYRMMMVNTDGTIPSKPPISGRLVNEPSLFHPERNPWKVPWKVSGPLFTSLSPDGKHFYLSGLCAGTIKRLRRVAVEKTGFWRDGQVWKVDLATRKATVFFALDESKVIGSMSARGRSPIADTRSNPYTALHGVAVDAEHHVFVCDRQNKRIVVLDKDGKVVREISVAYPDAIALNPDSKALYVTTRFGNYHRRGAMKLLKFNDWTKDTKPSVTLPLCRIGTYPQRSFLAVTEARGKVLVWVAYTVLPVRIYQDGNAGLKLVKDFYAAGPQRCLDVQHMAADPKTETVYFADGFKKAFMIRDWKNPRFERCMTGPGKGLVALSVAIDARNRYLYTHDYIRGKVKYSLYRYRMDGKYLPPAPVGKTGNHAISGQRVSNDWNIGCGMSQRGIAVAPDGGIAALGSTKHTDYSGPLFFFKHNSKTVPWEPLYFGCFGKRPQSAGVRFDPAGNMYVGKLARGKSRAGIYKFNPTGSLKKGCLFPSAPKKPARVYIVDYGFPAPAFSRTPRFGVDGYGRIYYPTSLLPQVSVMDNEGNSIVRFGTYGNRDSMGGLKGDLVPTKGIPMAWPNSVDATDDYIYVTDIVNIRLLRIARKFAVSVTTRIK